MNALGRAVRCAAFAALALVAVAPRAADQVTLWSTATATRPSDGHVIVYRYASAWRAGFARAHYPDRVTLAWSYASANGLPDTTLYTAMNRLEDLLEPRLADSPLAQLALVSTGNNLREWVFYTRSRDEFMTVLNAALKDQPRFPIEIDLARDAGWSRYDTFRNSLATP